MGNIYSHNHSVTASTYGMKMNRSDPSNHGGHSVTSKKYIPPNDPTFKTSTLQKRACQGRACSADSIQNVNSQLKPVQDLSVNPRHPAGSKILNASDKKASQSPRANIDVAGFLDKFNQEMDLCKYMEHKRIKLMNEFARYIEINMEKLMEEYYQFYLKKIEGMVSSYIIKDLNIYRESLERAVKAVVSIRKNQAELISQKIASYSIDFDSAESNQKLQIMLEEKEGFKRNITSKINTLGGGIAKQKEPLVKSLLKQWQTGLENIDFQSSAASSSSVPSRLMTDSTDAVNLKPEASTGLQSRNQQNLIGERSTFPLPSGQLGPNLQRINKRIRQCQNVSVAEVARTLLNEPAENINHQFLSQLKNVYDFNYCVVESTNLITEALTLFIWQNPEYLAQNSGLLIEIEDFIFNCICKDYSTECRRTPLKNIVSVISITRKKQEEILSRKLLSSPVKPDYEGSKRQALCSEFELLCTAMDSRINLLQKQIMRPGYDSFLFNLWQVNLKEILNQQITTVFHSEVLGENTSRKYLRETRRILHDQAGIFTPSDNALQSQPQLAGDAENIVKQIITSEKKDLITRNLSNLSEREFVVIATRAQPSVARHIIDHANLSLASLAEIGRFHPDLITPMLDQGLFQHKQAVPHLVRFASPLPDIAKAILAGRYNPHLTPSWQGKLAAQHPELAWSLWQTFTQIQVSADQPDKEWQEALAHISQQKRVADAVLRNLKTANNKQLVAACGWHHQELINLSLIDQLKQEPRLLVKLIQKHGVEKM